MPCKTIGVIVTLILSLLTAPLAAEAQPPTKMYRIGRLSAGSPPEVSLPGQRTAEALEDVQASLQRNLEAKKGGLPTSTSGGWPALSTEG